MKALLTAKADVSLEDSVGDTPVFTAALCGFVEVVKELNATENANATNKRHGQTILESTIPTGHVAVVLELLKNKAIVSDRCLHEAAKLASPDIMRALLANGGAARINALNRLNETPLHTAARSGNLPLVEELIANDADLNAINSPNIGPLAGSLPVVKRLLACTSQLSMSVYCAAKSGNVEVLEAVLSHPSANVEEGAESAWRRPLGIAVGRGHLSAVKLLLSHGANPDGNKSDDSHPIHFTSSWNNERPDIMRLLIDSGADVNILDEKGRSALHIAATYNRTECARLLLESGADIFAIDNEGSTPKEARVRCSNDGSCELLLARYERSAGVLHIERRTEGLL